MKKLVVAIAVLLTMTIGAQAQDSLRHKQHGFKKHPRGEFYKQLNLTDAQKQQVKKLNGDFRTKMEDLQKNDQMTVKEMKEKKMALMNERRSAFEQVLTSEQKTKFDELRKQAKEKRSQHQRKDTV